MSENPELDRCPIQPYARLCEGGTEQEISLEELEEVALNEASAMRARESVEATALERWMRSYERMMKQWQW
jgi:hypothetical protein